MQSSIILPTDNPIDEFRRACAKLTSKTLDEFQKSCVDLLMDTLEEAMRGRISTVGIGCCMDDGIAPVMAGKNAGGLMLALVQLQEEIRQEIFEKGNVAKKRSAIVRAR